MNTKLEHKEFLSISNASVISGTIPCSSAAPPITTDPRTALFIGLTNPSNTQSVKYAIYNNLTGHVVSSGTIPKGNSKSVVVNAQDIPNVIRIQNQSSCNIGGITPILTYSAAIQG